jgi:hypothetical protein
MTTGHRHRRKDDVYDGHRDCLQKDLEVSNQGILKGEVSLYR